MRYGIDQEITYELSGETLRKVKTGWCEGVFGQKNVDYTKNIHQNELNRFQRFMIMMMKFDVHENRVHF